MKECYDIILQLKTKLKSNKVSVDKDPLDQCLTAMFAEETSNEDCGDNDIIDGGIVEEISDNYKHTATTADDNDNMAPL